MYYNSCVEIIKLNKYVEYGDIILLILIQAIKCEVLSTRFEQGVPCYYF